MYCDRLYAELVAGRPNASRDCREHGLATAEMIDVSLRDRIVGLDEQHLLLWNDGLAISVLKLGLPPLELLNHPRGEMNLPIPVLYSERTDFWR